MNGPLSDYETIAEEKEEEEEGKIPGKKFFWHTINFNFPSISGGRCFEIVHSTVLVYLR